MRSRRLMVRLSVVGRRARVTVLAAVAVLAAVLSGCSKRNDPIVPPVTSGATVRGVVSDTTGAAVVGATVTLAPVPTPVSIRKMMRMRDATALRRGGSEFEPAGGNTLRLDGTRATTTDGAGEFAFHDVPAASYVITASAPNHLADSRSIEVAGTTGAPVVVQLRIRTTGRFEGRVTLAGAASHAGTVVFIDEGSWVALTDASGHYRIDDVPLGMWTLSALHNGYLDESQPGTISQEGEVVTLPDLELERDLNLPPTASIEATGKCGGYLSKLTATAGDPDGVLVGYEWDFEDDGSVDTSGATLNVVDHSYPVGAQRAKLIVTDNRGARGIAVASFTIEAPETVYVSMSTGSPSGDGTRESPLATVMAAVNRPISGACPKRVILIAQGFYEEGIVLRSDQTLRGGFDRASWEIVPGQRTEIWVYASRARGTLLRDVELSDIEINAVNGPVASSSSIVMTLDRCGASVRFVRCRFVARNGQSGIPGPTGANGARGFDGFPASGSTGGRFPFNWHPTQPRGVDGPDGPIPGQVPNPGLPGPSGPCASGGPGGSAGGNGVCANRNAVDGGSGEPGQNGPNGTGGSALISNGEFLGLEWSPFTGASGSGGCGGGHSGSGGAGGSFCATAGGGGGSGATGGRGGAAGSGGRGGGASITVVLKDSDPVFDRCEFVSGLGASGGEGGAGGVGGQGGWGGAGGVTAAASGGQGGDGGAAGHGGGGQGGAGGPSWCIVRLGSSNPELIAPTYTVGAGGAGGLGGRLGQMGTRAASGPNGAAAIFGP